MRDFFICKVGSCLSLACDLVSVVRPWFWLIFCLPLIEGLPLFSIAIVLTSSFRPLGTQLYHPANSALTLSLLDYYEVNSLQM